MTWRWVPAILAVSTLALASCAEPADTDDGAGGTAMPAEAGETAAPERERTAAVEEGAGRAASEGLPPGNVVEIRAVGLEFEGPAAIPSGWTTFRFANPSGMVHFALVDELPEGKTPRDMAVVAGVFQEGMDAMNAGDDEGAAAAFTRFPEWMGQLVRRGGPGLLSTGHTGETTVHLEPGHYMLECYVKSNGIFHTTSPAPGELGMMMGFEVTDQASGAPEPKANASLTISNEGYVLTDGALEAGRNTIRVVFAEQQAFPSFLGNDVHIARLEDGATAATVARWMDWREPEGLQVPAPVTFLGGVNDMPAGATAYMTVDLAPGAYIFIGENPDPIAAGLALPFTIAE